MKNNILAVLVSFSTFVSFLISAPILEVCSVRKRKKLGFQIKQSDFFLLILLNLEIKQLSR